MSTYEDISEALDNAIENGNDILRMDNEGIALDLQFCCRAAEDVPIPTLTQWVKQWREARQKR